jgi:hypothetical protein
MEAFSLHERTFYYHNDRYKNIENIYLIIEYNERLPDIEQTEIFDKLIRIVITTKNTVYCLTQTFLVHAFINKFPYNKNYNYNKIPLCYCDSYRDCKLDINIVDDDCKIKNLLLQYDINNDEFTLKKYIWAMYDNYIYPFQPDMFVIYFRDKRL